MPRLSRSDLHTGPARPVGSGGARVRALRRAWLDGTLDLSVDLDDAGMDRLVEELYGSDQPHRTVPPASRR